MAYECPVIEGTLQLVRDGQHWAIEFNGSPHGRWSSPDEAAMAAAHHRAGLQEWDRSQWAAPEDLMRWRPIGDSL